MEARRAERIFRTYLVRLSEPLAGFRALLIIAYVTRARSSKVVQHADRGSARPPKECAIHNPQLLLAGAQASRCARSHLCRGGASTAFLSPRSTTSQRNPCRAPQIRTPRTTRSPARAPDPRALRPPLTTTAAHDERATTAHDALGRSAAQVVRARATRRTRDRRGAVGAPLPPRRRRLPALRARAHHEASLIRERRPGLRSRRRGRHRGGRWRAPPDGCQRGRGRRRVVGRVGRVCC